MVLRPIPRPIQRKILRPLIAAAQRVFITADPVLETHFPLENTKTLTGNFRVGALCVLPTAATTVTLHGQLASVSNYFKVLSTGFASISIGGSIVTSTVLATKDSKFRIYDVELSGNDFLFQENGVTIDTVTDAGAAANSLVIDVLCQSNGADFFDGIYADPKITDITTPSNSESWKINRAFPATTEQSSSGNNILTYNNAPDSTRELFTFIDGRWVGQNIIINGGFDSSAGWTLGSGWSIGNGVASSDGSVGAFAEIIRFITPNSGSIYECKYTALNYVAGFTTFKLGNVNGISRSSNGEFTELIVATAGNQLGVRGLSNFEGSIDNVSVKRIIEVA